MTSCVGRSSESDREPGALDLSPSTALFHRCPFVAALDVLPDPVMLVDEPMRIVWINQSAETVLGRRRDELLGQPLSALFEAADHGSIDARLAASLARSCEDPVAIHVDGAVRHADGRRIPVMLALHHVADGDHPLLLATPRETGSADESDGLEPIILSMFAHEMRSALTVVRSYADLLEQHEGDKVKAVERISRGAEHLTRLVADLTDVAALCTGRFQLRLDSADLVALVQDAVERARLVSTRHLIQVDVPACPVWRTCDPDRLGQVLDNLLSNALKYSPNGERVTVGLEIRSSHVRLKVSDRGIGLSNDAQRWLFRPFQRGEAAQAVASGLGLGLYITNLLVEAHGGQIHVTSHLGEGSSFSVVLPDLEGPSVTGPEVSDIAGRASRSEWRARHRSRVASKRRIAQR